MTNTHTLSRRIVAALVERGIEVPEELRGESCPHCGSDDLSEASHWEGVRCEQCDCLMDESELDELNVPDLAQPENLHLLLEVADGLGEFPCEPTWSRQHKEWVGRAWKHRTPFVAYGPTRSLAILAAVCAALGIDTTQETTE